MGLLTDKELHYIYETTDISKFPYIYMENHNEKNISTSDCYLNGGHIPVFRYAPLSFQTIILFTALDILNSRFKVNRLNKEFQSKGFYQIANALPFSNDTECIYKFCYLIILDLRNKYIHQFPDEKSHNILTDNFELSNKGIEFLFSLILLYIDLYDGGELNKYDSEILKYYVHIVYDEIRFSNILDKSKNKYQDAVEFLFKDEKFELNKSIKTIEFRYRHIIKVNHIQELTNFKRIENLIPCPQGDEIKLLNSIDYDEYLIIIQNKKYLVIGEYLEKCVKNLDELSKWELRGNWIGKINYQRCYESSN